MKHVGYIILAVAVSITIAFLLQFDRVYDKKHDACALADCDLPSRKKLKILLWGSPIDNPAMKFFQEACRDFMAANPSVTIEVDYYTVEHYKSKLPVLMAANQTPDIFMTWCGAFLESFVESGKVAPLNHFIDASPDWQASFPHNAFDQLTYDEKIYGVPSSRVLAVLFYNSTIFDTLSLPPPSTYANLMNAVAPLKNKGIIPLAFGNREPWIGGMLAGLMMHRLAGKDMLAEIKHGTAAWTDPVVIKTGEIMQQWSEQGLFPPHPNTIDYSSTVDLFQTGKAAMMVMGSWYIQHYLHNSSKTDFSLGLAAFPNFPDGNDDTHAWMGQADMNLAIGAGCKEKETAFQLIKWVTSKKYQRKLLTEAGLLPAVNLSVDKADIPGETLALMDLLNSTKSLFIFPDIGLGRPTGQEFNRSVQRIVAGDDSLLTWQQMQKSPNSLGGE